MPQLAAEYVVMAGKATRQIGEWSLQSWNIYGGGKPQSDCPDPLREYFIHASGIANRRQGMGLAARPLCRSRGQSL
jgi:hypothetical protein